MRSNRTGAEALAAALAAGLLYGRTLAPTVGAGDSGELILAAHTLGVPHPPGYPLWTLLARLATLVPAGSVALRVNALSAVLTAVAVGVFHLLARRVGLRAVPAAIATSLFAASTLVWRSAVEAEVYPLATLMFLLLATLALRARSPRTASVRSDAMYFFVAGLALLAHQTLLFPALLLGAWTLAYRPDLRRVAAALGWTAAGASLVLAIPIRSAAHPAFAWTQGGGLHALLDALFRRSYGGLRQNPIALDLVAGEIAGMAALVGVSLGVAGSILSATGGFLAGRERHGIRAIAVAALTVPAALIALLAFTPDPEHLAQIEPFLAPVAAVAALLAGSGAAGLWTRATRRTRPWVAAAAAACVLGTLILHGAACDRSGFRLAERYGRDLLRALPPDATLVLDGDNETFLAAYATRLEGLRPDVTLVHRRGYLFGDPYGLAGQPRSRWVEIAHRVDLDRLESAKGAIYYASPPPDLIEAGVRFTSEGLIDRAALPGARPPAAAWMPSASWPRSGDLLPGGPARYDYVTRKLAVSYSDAAARALWNAGRSREALPWFEDAARVGYDFPAARLNLATAAAASGDADRALTELLAARSLAPRDPEPAARLAVFLDAAGRPRQAAIWFEKAYGLKPAPSLAGDAARAWTRAGDLTRAKIWRERALADEEDGGPGGRIPG
jgi:tetratricopeptide (TPR) repeat protein